jgi:hypothetical protein
LVGRAHPDRRIGACTRNVTLESDKNYQAMSYVDLCGDRRTPPSIARFSRMLDFA